MSHSITRIGATAIAAAALTAVGAFGGVSGASLSLAAAREPLPRARSQL